MATLRPRCGMWMMAHALNDDFGMDAKGDDAT
jgi:hypothetical protein